MILFTSLIEVSESINNDLSVSQAIMKNMGFQFSNLLDIILIDNSRIIVEK